MESEGRRRQAPVVITFEEARHSLPLVVRARRPKARCLEARARHRQRSQRPGLLVLDSKGNAEV